MRNYKSLLKKCWIGFYLLNKCSKHPNNAFPIHISNNAESKFIFIYFIDITHIIYLLNKICLFVLNVRFFITCSTVAGGLEKTTGPSGVEPETAGFLSLELKVRYSTWLSYGPIRYLRFSVVYIIHYKY